MIHLLPINYVNKKRIEDQEEMKEEYHGPKNSCTWILVIFKNIAQSEYLQVKLGKS